MQTAVYREAVEVGLQLGSADALLLQEACENDDFVVKSPEKEEIPLPDSVGQGERESLLLAIDLKAKWLLIDDLEARLIAERNLKAVGVSTGIKGTLGVIVTAAKRGQVHRSAAIEKVRALKSRPDVWLSVELCDRVIQLLRDL